MYFKDAEEFKVTCGYVIHGTWMPRVTKILEVKSKPALDVFLKEMDSFAQAEEVKLKSAAEGSLVHDAVQKLATGQSVEVHDSIKGSVQAFLAFNDRKKIVFHPEYVERQVWSLRYRYAGTVDALATIDGKFGVLDIKTSTGFYPEYNLQTAAYASALQEFEIKRALALPRDIQTRWILRIDQRRLCRTCKSSLREKGGRRKVRPPYVHTASESDICPNAEHEWSEVEGDVALREFPYLPKDARAFFAAKTLWEWEHDYWLKRAGYLK